MELMSIVKRWLEWQELITGAGGGAETFLDIGAKMGQICFVQKSIRGTQKSQRRKWKPWRPKTPRNGWRKCNLKLNLWKSCTRRIWWGSQKIGWLSTQDGCLTSKEMENAKLFDSSLVWSEKDSLRYREMTSLKFFPRYQSTHQYDWCLLSQYHLDGRGFWSMWNTHLWMRHYTKKSTSVRRTGLLRWQIPDLVYQVRKALYGLKRPQGYGISMFINLFLIRYLNIVEQIRLYIYLMKVDGSSIWWSM